MHRIVYMADSRMATNAPHPQKKNTKKALITYEKCIFLLKKSKKLAGSVLKGRKLLVG